MPSTYSVSILAISLSLAFAALASDQQPGGLLPAPTTAKTNSTERLREGTRLVDQIGKFEFAGDRVAFYPNDSSDSFRVLENLALERISRVLGDTRGKQEWILSGTLTEFRGANYLLITKAILRNSNEQRLPMP